MPPVISTDAVATSPPLRTAMVNHGGAGSVHAPTRVGVPQTATPPAWQPPHVLDQSRMSARAWLFTVARDLVIDEHRSARHRREVSTDSPRRSGPSQDPFDRALDAWLIADAA